MNCMVLLTENSTPSEKCHLTAAQSRSRHQSREHRIQRHMSNLAADIASSGQCDFVLEIPWNSRAVRFGGCIHERLKGFHCAWVPACAWGLQTDSKRNWAAATPAGTTDKGRTTHLKSGAAPPRHRMARACVAKISS